MDLAVIFLSPVSALKIIDKKFRINNALYYWLCLIHTLRKIFEGFKKVGTSFWSQNKSLLKLTCSASGQGLLEPNLSISASL